MKRAMAALLVMGLGWGAGVHAASTFPDRAVRLVVPYAPGGGPDQTTRVLADVLAPILGTSVVVENRVGAGGMIGADAVARAAPDGYTLLLGGSSHVTQRLLQPELKFDPVDDFTHIVRQSFGPQVLVVASDSPYTSIDELVSAARERSDPFNYASGGLGGAAHLAGEIFSKVAEMPAVHIPYRGSVDIVPAILTRDVQFGVPPLSTAMPYIRSGKVRPLAVTSDTRIAALPDTPTFNEFFGRQDLGLDAWVGIWAPRGVPPDVTAKLEAAFKQALASPRMHDISNTNGSVISVTESPEAFHDFVVEQRTRFARFIDIYDITISH